MINDHIGEVFFALCKSIDTPVSLGCWLRYKYSHTELASCSIEPRNYSDYATFYKDYICVSYLSKYSGLDTGIDLEAVALQKFTTSEAACRRTNIRLRSEIGSRTRFEQYIHTARRKISRLLGEFSVDKISCHYGWGPGASTDLRRSMAQLDRKMCELPIPVTRSARSLLASEMGSDLHWSAQILGVMPEGDFSFLPHVFLLNEECRIETVPKNAKTHRVIAIENRGNSFLQKGFGGYFRKRLRKVGVDLDNQELNQENARLAFSEGLATLDLKAASDTISVEAVWLLLPYDWAASLDAVRSRFALQKDGSVIKLEKFSSMGNGFTFELESLIFWALAQTISEFGSGKQVSIYGDDIICASEDYDELVLLLNHCGFEVNMDKSYSDGLFYESCGKHFFRGVDCTPAYQKETLDDDTCIIRAGNRLLRLGVRLCSGLGIDRTVFAPWKVLRRLSMSDCAIPFSLQGDDGWSLPRSEFPPIKYSRKAVRDGWEPGILCKVHKPRRQTLPAIEGSLLAWSLRRGVKTDSPYNGNLTVSSSVLRSVGFRQVIPDRSFELTWY